MKPKFAIGDKVTVIRNGATAAIIALGNQSPNGEVDYQLRLDATGKTVWHYESELKASTPVKV